MKNVRYDNRRGAPYRDSRAYGCGGGCADQDTVRIKSEWKDCGSDEANYRMPGTKTGVLRDGVDMNAWCEMKKRLMSLYFVVTELELFLDVHPQNCAALARYKCAVKEYKELAAVYEKKYGPLLARSNDSANEWLWVCEPWPWEV